MEPEFVGKDVVLKCPPDNQEVEAVMVDEEEVAGEIELEDVEVVAVAGEGAEAEAGAAVKNAAPDVLPLIGQCPEVKVGRPPHRGEDEGPAQPHARIKSCCLQMKLTSIFWFFLLACLVHSHYFMFKLLQIVLPLCITFSIYMCYHVSIQQYKYPHLLRINDSV